MNLNPTLIMGLAARVADEKHKRGDVQLFPATRDRLELRIYPENNPDAHYFVRGYQANSWYIRENDSDHFNRAATSDVATAVEVGATVQLVGPRGESFGIWSDMPAFLAEAQL